MLIESLISGTLGYLVSSIKNSKGGKKAGDELSTALWDWIRPLFLVEEKEDEAIKDLKQAPEDPDNQQEVAIRLKKHLRKNPEAQAELQQLLARLEASDQKPGQVNITQTHYGSGDNVGGDKIIGK